MYFPHVSHCLCNIFFMPARLLIQHFQCFAIVSGSAIMVSYSDLGKGFPLVRKLIYFYPYDPKFCMKETLVIFFLL